LVSAGLTFIFHIEVTNL